MEHANMEIERKYLTRSDGWRTEASSQPIRQGYLTLHGSRAVVRVRIAGDSAFLTVKGGRKGSHPGQGDTDDNPASGRALQHVEYEYPIPIAHAEAMLEQMARRPLIEKTRYRVPHAQHVWEVDEFCGANTGLVVAEVELERAEQRPTLPAWVGDEVTDDSRYTNSALSERPFTTWQHDDPLLIKHALAYAVHAHDGQTRKGTAIPYVTHPIRVAATLINAGCETVIAAAGYLHDTVEDTYITASELRRAFGPDIADLVAAASELDKTAPWEQRKRHTLDALPTLGPRQLWVPLADKIDNVESIGRDLDAVGVGNEERVWRRFSRSAEQQERYYRALVDVFRDTAGRRLVPEPTPSFCQLVSRLTRAVTMVFGAQSLDEPGDAARHRDPARID